MIVMIDLSGQLDLWLKFSEPFSWCLLCIGEINKERQKIRRTQQKKEMEKDREIEKWRKREIVE